jgi:putative hemolysin
LLTEILFLIILIFINAFFAASEIALISLNDNKIKVMADDGNKKAKKLKKLLSEPSRFLATIQIGITLAGFLASAFAAESFSDRLMAMVDVSAIPISASLLKTLSVVFITIILSYFTLVFGELVPKRVAMKKSESIAFGVVTPLVVLSAFTSPFVKLLTASTNFFIKIFGMDPNAEEDSITKEEIRMMVDVGEEKGTIHESEKQMINNIFEFDDTTAGEIMTHRTEIVAVEDNSKISDIVYIAINEGFSRIPVYKEDIDNIIGIIYVKDLLCLVGCSESEDFKISDFIREVLYVPESNRCIELFKEFTDKKAHMAVVVDEYGGTAGIVTMEDLLETIVGSIQDEYDDEEDEIEQIGDNTYTIDGSADIEDVAELLDLAIDEDADYDTLGGLITEILGRIPTENEQPVVTVDDVEFTVLGVEERRITKVKAVKLTQDDESDKDDK